MYDKAIAKDLENNKDYATKAKKVISEISTNNELVNDNTTNSKNLEISKEYDTNDKKVISEKSTKLVNDKVISKELINENVNKAEYLKEVDKMKLVSRFVYQKVLLQTFHTSFLTTQ